MQEINFKCDVQLQTKKLIQFFEKMNFRMYHRYFLWTQTYVITSQKYNLYVHTKIYFSRKRFSKYIIYYYAFIKQIFFLQLVYCDAIKIRCD